MGSPRNATRVRANKQIWMTERSKRDRDFSCPFLFPVLFHHHHHHHHHHHPYQKSLTLELSVAENSIVWRSEEEAEQVRRKTLEKMMTNKMVHLLTMIIVYPPFGTSLMIPFSSSSTPISRMRSASSIIIIVSFFYHYHRPAQSSSTPSSSPSLFSYSSPFGMKLMIPFSSSSKPISRIRSASSIIKHKRFLKTKPGVC